MASGALSTIRRISIAIAIALLFFFGLASTVYLSLRSPEVKVPDVVGKDRADAEQILGNAGLNFRVRANRPSQLKADTVLFQLPRGGDVVKVGQTVAMDVSRSLKEGESAPAAAEPTPDEKVDNGNANDASAANENRPKRNKNTNKNANENSNTNTGNRNANSNRSAGNNANNGNSNKANSNKANSNQTNSNSRRPTANANASPNRNGNENRTTRPPARPSPAKPPGEN